MATRQRNMNNGAHGIAKKAFADLLKAGAFPKIEYSESVGMYGGTNTSYSMIEYSTVWATYTKVVQKKLIEAGFEFGLWQNARNKLYLAAVEEAVKGITETQVNECSDRFRTMWD